MADYDKVIPPGKEGKINVKIYGSKVYPGPIEKHFNVRTNDPDHQSFTLGVKVHIKKTLELSRELRWAGFADEELKLETIITNLLDKPLHITSISWDQEAKNRGYDQKLGLKLETIEKGKKYKLKIWNRKELKPENFVANVVLSTDHPNLKEKKLLLSVNITPDVELHPDRLYFSEMVVPPGATKSYERQFNIVLARGDSLKILDVQPNRDDMTVKLQELVPGKSFRGTVLVRPSSRMGQYMGSVKITTNHPRYKVLNLDVIGSVRVEGSAEKQSKSSK